MPIHVSPAVDSVRIAVIERGRANALDREMVEELRRAVAALDETEVLVITGHGEMLSGGLDSELVRRGDTASTALLDASLALLFDILESPRPVVVAAPGHAVAVGALLLLAADYRVVTDRPAAYGFPEVSSGLALPSVVAELINHRVAPPHAMRLATHSELAEPADAVRIGLADELVPTDELMPRSVEHAQRLALLPPASFGRTKRRVNAAVVAAMRSVMA